MIARLEVLANCHIPAPPPCSERKFMEAMATMQACLPSRNQSDISLEVQAEAYWRMLGKYTVEQIEFLKTESISRCKWFPTVAECLDILSEKDASNPLQAKRERVKYLIRREKVARFDDWINALKHGQATQESVDSAPPQWLGIAEERGLLRRLDDGSFVIRSLWHGPIRNGSAANATEKREKRRYCSTCLFSSDNPLTESCAAPNCGLRAPDGDAGQCAPGEVADG